MESNNNNGTMWLRVTIVFVSRIFKWRFDSDIQVWWNKIIIFGVNIYYVQRELLIYEVILF